MYVCVCVCCAVVYAFAVCKGVEAHDMQHFLHEIFNYLRFLVCMCLRYCTCVCVHEHVCVFRRVLLVLCLPVCVAEAWNDPGSLGNKPFETRDLVPYMYYVDHDHNCDLTIVQKNVNQNPLNRIGIFWYHFTPRKLLSWYQKICSNRSTLAVRLFGFFFFFGGGSTLYLSTSACNDQTFHNRHLKGVKLTTPSPQNIHSKSPVRMGLKGKFSSGTEF